jgi:hypothetical protein
MKNPHMIDDAYDVAGNDVVGQALCHRCGIGRYDSDPVAAANILADYLEEKGACELAEDFRQLAALTAYMIKTKYVHEYQAADYA